MIRCLFCLFAEDNSLLPDRLFTRIFTQARQRPQSFAPQLQPLFQTMSTGGFFGVLHSRVHEVWSLATSSRHGVAGDIVYNNTTCLETFPFPWSLDQEPGASAQVNEIGQAAAALVKLRDELKLSDGRYGTIDEDV